MPKKLSLSKKIYGKGPRKLVGDIISSNVNTVKVREYKMALQPYTFIVEEIKGVKKIIYIENLGEDFFSNENVYDINYIKNLKVEFVKNYTEKSINILLSKNRLKIKSI